MFLFLYQPLGGGQTMIRFHFRTIYDRQAFAIVFAILRLHFTISVDWSRRNQFELGLYSNRSRLLAWESYIVFNTGKAYTDHVGRKVRRFALAFWHSDHYVLLARRIAERMPWLAEYSYEEPDPENDGFTILVPPSGRIKPFGWATLKV
jgi:hypothetical protein